MTKIEFELANGPKGSDNLGSSPLRSDVAPQPGKQPYISNSSGLEYSQSNPHDPSASLSQNLLSEAKMSRPLMTNPRPGKAGRDLSGGNLSGGFAPQADELCLEFPSDSQISNPFTHLQVGQAGQQSGSNQHQQLIDLEGFSPFQSELVSDSRLEGMDFQPPKPSHFQQQAFAHLNTPGDYEQEFEFSQGNFPPNMHSTKLPNRRGTHNNMALSSPAPMLNFHSPTIRDQVIVEEPHGGEMQEEDPDHDQLDLDDVPTAPMTKAKQPQQVAENVVESGGNKFSFQESELKSNKPGTIYNNNPSARLNSLQVSDSLMEYSVGGALSALKDSAAGISRRGWNMKGFHPAKPVEVSVRQFYGNPEGFPEVLIDPYAFQAANIYESILESTKLIKEAGNHKTYQARLPAHPQLRYFS